MYVCVCVDCVVVKTLFIHEMSLKQYVAAHIAYFPFNKLLVCQYSPKMGFTANYTRT